MAYATYSEFTNWYTSSKSQTEVESMLTWASEIIDKYCGTKFTATSGTTTLYGDGYKESFLMEHAPLISVTDVKEYDSDGNTTTLTVNHILSEESVVVLDSPVTANRRVVFTYQYGNTNDTDLAKLVNIHLAKAGLDMMSISGGVFPSISVTKGDLSYSLRHSSLSAGTLMSVIDLLDKLKYRRPYIVEGKGAGGLHEKLRQQL